MEGGIFFIVVLVIGAILSAASSAKKKSGSNQGAPPRRTMSDIQRAFMMMSGLDNEDEEQQTRNVPPAAPQQPRYTPPAAPQQPRNVQPAAPRAAYTPPVSTVQSRLSVTPRSVYGEGASDYGAARSGSLGPTTIEKEAGIADNKRLRSNPSESSEGYSSEYNAAPSGSLRGNTAIENEAGIGKYTAAAQSIKEAEESINENELEMLKEDLSQEVETVKHTAKPALKLFADKNEYLRAVIYSEILGSGPLARRSSK